MIWLLVALTLVIFMSFSLVVFVGAPYLPTLTPQMQAAIRLANLQPGDTLLELGCGDGKVVAAAAAQGYKVVGYELNPILAVICWARCFKYRRQVKIIWGNFWSAPWPPAEAIFVFLLPKYMKKLDKKIVQYSHKPVKLISFAFEIPGQQPTKTAQGVFRYDYR